MIAYQHNTKGFTILFAVLVASIALAIGVITLDVAKRQVELSGVLAESEAAFQAASAGLECAQYHNSNDVFDVPAPPGSQSSATTISCFGNNDSDNAAAGSGDEQSFEWTWSSGTRCTKVSVWKFFDPSSNINIPNSISSRPDCLAGFECTVIKAQGYNTGCSSLATEGTVERELTFVK